MRQRTTRDAHTNRPGRPRPSRRAILTDLGGVERLDRRILPAVTATYSAAQGILTVLGDAHDNKIEISRNPAGSILVNGGAVKILGGKPSVANTALVQVFGLNGNDTLSLSEVNGALPRANLFGGAGNDVIVGGSGNDLLFGEAGNDTLLGKGGNDMLFGGDGNDLLTGGAGTDQVFGQAGNDRMIWNPGDGTDLNEGGAGIDTSEVNGGNGAEDFTITANGSRVRFDRINPAPFSLDIGSTENLVVNANGGDDSITAGNGLATLIKLTLNGGTGNDVLTGGDGNDVIDGGDGNDRVAGGRGNDAVLLGAGDDTFVWNPGDGSDTVEGQAGNDSLIFNGANIAEQFEVSANGSRVRFTRDIGAVTMDLNGIEAINLNALGGADKVTVHNTAGTDLAEVNLDLANPPGTGMADGSADSVIVNGTDDADVIFVDGDASAVAVSGLSAQVNIKGAEAALDRLTINARGGDDVVTAVGLSADAIALTANGGDGDDILIGGDGNDTLNGDGGDDILIGGPGQDILNGGPGDNCGNPGLERFPVRCGGCHWWLATSAPGRLHALVASHQWHTDPSATRNREPV